MSQTPRRKPLPDTIWDKLLITMEEVSCKALPWNFFLSASIEVCQSFFTLFSCENIWPCIMKAWVRESDFDQGSKPRISAKEEYSTRLSNVPKVV